MTCFWDAIRRNLAPTDYAKIGINNNNITHQEFIKALQEHNKATTNVKWQGEELSRAQRTENYVHVRDYNSESIHQGYDCSTFDPFLFLYAELFNLSIRHNFNGVWIDYQKHQSYRTITLCSDRGHIN